MTVQSWMTTFLNASSRARRRMVESVLDGIQYFNAKWKKVSESEKGIPQYELKSMDKAIKQFYKDLKKEKNVKLVGVSPEITYMKVDGNKTQLEALWEHKFGSPALLYAHDELPMLILAGPSIMFNDSIRNRIPENPRRDKVFGVTG